MIMYQVKITDTVAQCDIEFLNVKYSKLLVGFPV